jgi:D-alanyl-D-alanine carboxypeptidase (penicillin-binding protein 5/6)
MRKRHVVLFIFFTLLILFYPGNSDYFQVFAFNRPLFQKKEKEFPLKPIGKIPIVQSLYQPLTTAEGIYIVELSTLTPLFEYNPQKKLFPASTAKIITALTANDLYQFDDVITVNNVNVEGQIMGLVEGEKITFENLLYGMLIHSGNDAAYAIANAYGYDKFIELMNKKARSLQMINSNFSNPAGLDDQNQYTTPYDLTLAARELLSNKALKKIVSIKDITISDVDYKYFHSLTNVNKLLGEIHGIGGLKTGHTESAGDNLVSYYRNNNNEYIITVLKSLDRFEDTKNLVKWLNESVSYYSED